MTQIENLYGVIHGGVNIGMFGTETPMRLPLSDDLASELSSMIPGKKVGIEYTPELAKPYVEGDNTLIFAESTIWYWQAVQALCEELGLEVAHIDSYELNLKSAKRGLRSEQLQSKLLDGYDSDEEFWKLRRGSHRAYIESRMIHELQRELHMWKAIGQVRPDALILGKAHADLLMTSKKIRQRSGLEVVNFHTEDEPEDGLGIWFADGPTNEALVDRNQLLRNYHAIKEGRISPNRKPSHRGIFQLASVYTPEQGLFEIFPQDDGSFSGIISDTIGDARFVGEITPRRVQFEKTYIKSRSVPGPKRNPITYEGRRDGENYLGTWRTLSGAGTFVLRAFDEGEDQKAFLDQSVEMI